MKMNKMLVAGIVGFSMLAGSAHAASWFKPNPYTYDKLAGNWYADVTLKIEGDTVRVCGTERFLANGTSRVEGEIILYYPETSDRLGVVVGVTLNSTNKIELIGDKLIRTTMSVNNELSELYFLQNEQVVEVTDAIRNQAIVDMKSVVAGIDSVNQVEQGTISVLTATHFTETDDNGTTIESVRTDKVVTECSVK